MNRIVRGALAAAACAAFVGTAAPRASAQERAVLARVNGEPIYRDAFVARLMDGTVTGKVLFAQLVRRLLIEQYASAHHITVTAAEIDAKEAAVRAKYAPGQFDAMLRKQALTESAARDFVRESVILEKAVAAEVHVDDAAVRDYFAKNRAAYDKPEQVKARHILVADEATAQIVLQKLRAGATWAELAKQYSNDPSTKNSGGELGFFSRGQMVPTFEQASFSAPVGQPVGPVKSPFGYHVIEVEARTERYTATFDAVKGSIRDKLIEQQTAERIPALMQRLRSAAKIEIYDARYEEAAASSKCDRASGNGSRCESVLAS